ncbi:hypothetical protein C8244_18835 [Paracidovorax avenae]|uniref:phosphoethanolamine transferase n=1 Tax=Paracidovorax avenae TaxID=80867 RepID=UPI000D169137|nr:phosphoethanolamine transferase [Paracidovorax avenae]AVS82903.1 hypothetical protein C8237_18705 [Paracidovorax avenae]AVT18029.1 hypothetical protein C8244_18835 [Paracidovorax avenae]AVT22111.1 hypothetical protein C7Y68_20545 [Paracidovorax avenae]
MKKFFVQLLIFVAIGLVPNLFRIQLPGELGNLQHIEGIVYSAALMILLAAICKRLWIAYAVAGVFLSWWYIEIYLRLEYRSGVTANFIGMLRETNADEIRSFFSTYASSLIFPWIFSLLCFAILLLWSVKSRSIWTHRSRYWVIISFFAGAGLLYSSFAMQEPEGIVATPDQFAVRPPSFWVSKWADIYPTNGFFAVWQYEQYRKIIAELKDKLIGYRFEQMKKPTPDPDTIVLVIGESSRRDRWSLFGYGRKTTPRLQGINGIVPIEDMVTVSVATRTSVPEMISKAPVQRADGSVATRPRPSLISLFKQFGYETYWISNQSSAGFFDTPIALYASEAGHQFFPNPTGFASRGSLDEVLLRPLENALNDKKKKLIVMHTMGSHFNYSYRYSAKYEVFRPALQRNEIFLPSDPTKKIEANNAYDNSILYTDSFLDAVIEKITSHEGRSLVLYLSDHGEDIFEPGCVSSGIARVSRHSYEIPSFLWTNKSYREQWPESVDVMRRLSKQPLLTQDAYSIILLLSGFTLDGDDSFLNEDRRERMVYAQNKWVDFDKEREKGTCTIGQE